MVVGQSFWQVPYDSSAAHTPSPQPLLAQSVKQFCSLGAQIPSPHLAVVQSDGQLPAFSPEVPSQVPLPQVLIAQSLGQDVLVSWASHFWLPHTLQSAAQSLAVSGAVHTPSPHVTLQSRAHLLGVSPWLASH
jgi:hypothetical protein